MSSAQPSSVEGSPQLAANDPYVDSLISDLNSLGLSPKVSASDIPKAAKDYLKYHFSPESRDPGVSPSDLSKAYIGLVQKLPLNDIVARVVLHAIVLPQTCPEPSADENDAFNLSVHALETLKDHLDAVPPTSPAWTEPLIEKIVDRMMAFIRYYVREIVAKNRTTDFQAVAGHDFHRLVIMVLNVMSQKHPLMKEDLKSIANAQRLKLRNFVADVIPALLVTYQSIEPSERKNFVVMAFHYIKTLQFLSTPSACRDTLNTNFFRFFAQSPTTNDAFASAFILVANFYRDTMLSLNSRQLEATNLSIVFAYHFLVPFIERDSSCVALLKAGFSRTSCELFSAILAAMHLYAVDGVPGPKQKGIIISSGDALCSISSRLSERMHLEGHVRVELFYEYDHPYQLREFDRALRSLPQEAAFGSTFAEDQLEYMTIYVNLLKPYLAYHDILEKAAKRFLGQPECAGESPVWKSFVSQIDRLEKVRIIFAESWRDVCQAPNCPSGDGLKTNVSLSRCSGCQMIHYCSRTCQQHHWQNGHKQHCALIKKERSKTGRLTGLPSRHDIYFMNGIARMTLARHPPFSHNAVPAGFVRHMDFTMSPPVLTLKSLNNPIYNESTRIVIGEDEMMNRTVRSRALSFMRETWEVGVVYYKKFPPGDSFNEEALTFLDWTVAPDGNLLYTPVNLDSFDLSKMLGIAL
ncbi:hypothetical protein BDZ89DRAFT_1161000 [Hymenopellis radicata]|nr:hypothetical protein BDZ89DRAFT_1161000 [Hymenopellis radicata]